MTSSLPSVSLSAGSYFLTLLLGADECAGVELLLGGVECGGVERDAYPTPSSSFGSANRESRTWSFYVTYTPAGPPPPPPPVPVNTTLPVVSGSAQVGAIVSASTGTWSNTPTSYGYQWQRCARGWRIVCRSGRSHQRVLCGRRQRRRFHIASRGHRVEREGPSTPAPSLITAVVTVPPPPPVPVNTAAAGGVGVGAGRRDRVSIDGNLVEHTDVVRVPVAAM